MSSMGAKLLPLGRRGVVIVDTCVFLNKGISICERLQAEGYQIATIPQVRREVIRKSEEKGLTNEDVFHLLPLDVELVNDNKPEIAHEATKIWAHFPDNILLASAKRYNAILLSYDQVLLGIAKYEEIPAYTPEQFLKTIKEHSPNVPSRLCHDKHTITSVVY